MKITGGIAKGLRIDAPLGNKTRPTTDRVRESVFGILRDLLPGAHVLDLFAGSGALGLEAASRGAEKITWVEKHPATAGFITRNFNRIAKANLPAEGHIHVQDVMVWLKNPPSIPVDLIFADPPYEQLDDNSTLDRLLNQILENRILKEDGLLVLECSRRSRLIIPPLWTQLRKEIYGSTCVLFLDGPHP